MNGRYKWPSHPDGRVKMPSELTPEERRALDREVDAQIEHESVTADYGSADESED